MRNPAENANFFSKTIVSPTEPTSDPLPTQNITGSGDYNSTTLKNRENYEAIFPFKDGSSEETRLPPPLDENGDPIDLQTVDLDEISPELFNQSFHSAHQLELLKRFDGDLALGTGDDRIDVLEGADGRTVLILQDITKNDLAQLSIDDQTLIVNYLTRSDVPDDVKQKLAFQWEAEVGGTVEQNREAATALVVAAIEGIENKNSQFDETYLEQLKIIQSKIDENVLFSLGSISAQINSIEERFERMNFFETSVSFGEQIDAKSEETDLLYGGGANSTDDDQKMRESLQTLVEQEQRILEVNKQRLNIATSERAIDLPSLVAVLQVTENIEKDIEAALLTIELEQNNELVKYYGLMQQILNDVQKKFNANKPEEKRDLFGFTGTNVSSGIFIPKDPAEDPVVTDQQTPFLFGNSDILVLGEVSARKDISISREEARAVIMFDRIFSSTGSAFNGVGHPLEEKNSIVRPLDNVFGATVSTDGFGDPSHGIPSDVFIGDVGDNPFLQKENGTLYGYMDHKTQAEWNLFATQLADAVTLINQRTQILTNDITTLNQESNRHFEQMNNALRRSIDMINAIGRAG